ncbi:histidine kinase [Kordia sp. SMS9]|uniref:sensor histidine kinase n=1 Tax=Kordia sp. SMS9 TaxID=2282170 RepID=UPI001F07A90E|nr:histidine kinase [Kordia sp. SMS9]
MNNNTFWVNGLDGSLSYWNGSFFEPFAFNEELKSLRPDQEGWLDFIGLHENTLFFQLIASDYWEITYPIYSINTCDGTTATHGEEILDFLNNTAPTDQIIKRRINIAKNLQAVKDSLKTLNVELRKISEVHFQWNAQSKIKNVKNITKEIIGLYIDENNNEWIATKAGVFYFKNGDLSAEPIIILEGIGVTVISKSKDGSLWVTSTDNGLFHIPNITIKKFKSKDWLDGETFYKLKKADNYLVVMSEKGRTFLLTKNQLNAQVDDNIIVDNLTNEKRKIISSSVHNYKGIFNMLQVENKTFLVYNSTGFNINTDKNYIPTLKYKFRTLSATIDRKKNIWIATTEGLFKWKNEYKKTEPALVPIQGIRDFRVNDVKMDNDGIWLATPKFGLVYKRDSLEYTFKHEKLSNKVLQAIYKQNDSTLWLGSNRGLLKAKYTFKNNIPIIEKMDVYTIKNGLISNYINDVSFWNDEIWLATDNGLCHFKPSQLSVSHTIPSLQIDFIETDKKQAVHTTQVTLPHNENDVTIHYTGISHNKPKKGFYRYKINDKPWVETNERKVSFLDLNHGEYAFKVQCRSDNSQWSNTKQLVFTIEPHFLERIWFKIAMICSVCIIIFLVIVRYKKNWQKKLENENRLRKSELTTLRNQMNPHFMFNSLTAIQGLIYKGEKLEANTYIGEFSRLMRKSLEYSKLENIVLEEEIQFIENYLELEKKRFKELFEYHIIIDPELSKSALQVPPLLIQPLLENCIKHGFRGMDKNKLIEISIQKHEHINDIFEVIIKDNGVGFDLSQLSNSSKSVGLGIVKDRISLIRENLNNKEVAFYIDSELGKGTTIRLLLPLNT